MEISLGVIYSIIWLIGVYAAREKLGEVITKFSIIEVDNDDIVAEVRPAIHIALWPIFIVVALATYIGVRFGKFIVGKFKK